MSYDNQNSDDSGSRANFGIYIGNQKPPKLSKLTYGLLQGSNLADFVPRAPVPTEHTFLREQWTSIRLMFIGRHFLCKRWGGQIDPQAHPRIHLSPDM